MAELRASDADRERTVAALRHHASAGRLSLEELDARSEQRVRREDADRPRRPAVADLPALASRPIRRHHGSRWPRLASFTARWHSPVSAELTMAELIATWRRRSRRAGFDLIQRADDRLRFERRRRPGWTCVDRGARPDFGWFALLHKDLVRITVDVAETGRGTQLVASGVAPRALRRTFGELED